MLRALAITAAIGISLTILADLRSQSVERDDTMRLAQSTNVPPPPRQTAEADPPKKDGPQAPEPTKPKDNNRVMGGPSAGQPTERPRPSQASEKESPKGDPLPVELPKPKTDTR